MRLASTLIFGLVLACGGDKGVTTSGDGSGGDTQGTGADASGTQATSDPATGGTQGGSGSTTQVTTGGSIGPATTTQGGSSGGGGETQWWATCGDPVCGGHTDMGLPKCPGKVKEGAACDMAGEQCDPVNDCNSIFVCAAEDPKQEGCPISRARFKRDIEYVDAAELQRLHDDLQKIRLATYRYREVQPEVTKLGMILEDGPDGPWIDGPRDRVDLYAYTSLAVAALQVQAEQIAELRRELDELRARQCAP